MKKISKRELRNNSGQIMQAVDRGESFIVTRNGVPVAELRPVARQTFVPADVAIASLRGAPKIDYKRFCRDVDRLVDQHPEPARLMLRERRARSARYFGGYRSAGDRPRDAPIPVRDLDAYPG